MRRSRRIFFQLMSIAIVAAVAGWGSAAASAHWRLNTVTLTTIAYNQGITFDSSSHSFFFDGVSWPTNSGLYRTNADGSLEAANFFVLPSTKEGYNHTGDLSFDPVQQRVLLALECFFPNNGGNTCGTGAIGVADPVSLRFLYYVNLDTAQIKKAMWDEISPDGRWIWTSSGTHLLVYSAADVNPVTAAGQRAGTTGGIVGIDLGSVLPDSGVTGAAFIQDPWTETSRLLLSLNLGTTFEVVAYTVGTAQDGSPMLLSTTPTTEIVVPKWFFANEPEGLAVTGALDPEADPLGGVLHWQILPTLTLLTLYVNVLGYVPAASDASAGQRTRPLRAFKAPVVRLPEICGHRCAQVGYVLRAGAVAAAHQRSPRRARTRGAALDAR